MGWTINFNKKAEKELSKLDKQVQSQIDEFLTNLQKSDDILSLGKPLKGELKGLIRYRVGNYRLVCQVTNQELIVVV